MDLDTQLAELWKEKSLWEVYKASPSFFKTRFNRNALISSCLLLAGFAAISFWARNVHNVQIPAINLFDVLGRWSEVGISYAATILGFLLAGFAVLFSLIRPQTGLALLRSSMGGMSALKFVLLLFLDVFVHYTAFLCWCFTFFLFGGRGGLLESLHNVAHLYFPSATTGAAYVLFVLWGTWLVLILLKLKSFIWNLYQVLLLAMGDAMAAEDKTDNS